VTTSKRFRRRRRRWIWFPARGAGGRVSYRRLLEIQSRLLARVLEGEIGEYPVFTTR
jgi:hypothetical protein